MSNPLFDALIAPNENSTNPFIYEQSGRIWTYSEFVIRVRQFASALADLGINEGDRVALQLEKSVNVLALCQACIQTGAVFLPLNPAYTATEVEYFLRDSGAKLFLCSMAKKPDFTDLSRKIGFCLETLDADQQGSLNTLAEQLPPKSEVAERHQDDLAALLYTSGTTGRSKGAMLTQANLLSNAQTLAKYWDFSKDDVLLHALPIFHTHGLFVATNTVLLTGGAMRFYEKFSTSDLVKDMPKATAMMGVPTFYTRLLQDPSFTAETAKKMRVFISGSAPMLEETHKQFTERTGHVILERYGMTETNMSTSNPYRERRKPGTVGRPLPGVEVRISDPNTGTPLKANEIGQIEVRGPNVFRGYWNMPEKTAAEFRDDGFFITGDLAFADDDGYVTIVGREKDLIITGGFNVYPKEVEAAIDELEGVLESAVIAVPHPDMGEAVVAVVVPSDDRILETSDISAPLSNRLARFKQPRETVFVEQLPRNSMGKVQKAELRKTYAHLFKIVD